MSLVLRAIRSAEHEQFVSQLLVREARWFRFLDGGPHLRKSHGPTEWNFVAVTPDGFPLGFGRLVYQDEMGVLVGSYAVEERWRRRGVGRLILGHLHTLAAYLDSGFIAAVFGNNASSLGLCQAHFGPELYRGDVDGAEVVVFGDAKAEASIWPEEKR